MTAQQLKILLVADIAKMHRAERDQARADLAACRAELDRLKASKGACLYVFTDPDGTSHCRLAESDIAKAPASTALETRTDAGHCPTCGVKLIDK